MVVVVVVVSGGGRSSRSADTKSSEFETVCDEVEAVSEKGLQNWTRHGLR